MNPIHSKDRNRFDAEAATHLGSLSPSLDRSSRTKEGFMVTKPSPFLLMESLCISLDLWMLCSR